MRHYKAYEPDQSVFISFSSKDNFPLGSFERFVVDVFGQISFDEAVFQAEADKGGEAPYDPRAVFGAIFYGFTRGVFSSRKLELACKQDLGFMYVSGFSTPDHSTFSRYISGQQNLIRDIFAKILYLADQQGYIDYRLIATDGTKIKANASNRFTGTIEEFQKKQKRFEEKIAKALARHNSSEESEEKKYWARKVDRYRENKQRVQRFLREAQRIETKKGKEIKQNITDPDCRIMKIGGAFGEGYNAQASCSGESGIVIAAMVGNNVDDKENLFKMESQIRSFVPECSQEQLSNSKYLFDNGYYSTDNVLKAIEKGIDIYIPDTQDSKYYSRKSHEPRGSVGIADCTIDYDEQGLFVTCPGGRILRDWKIKRNNGKESYRFPVLSPAKCEGCIYHSICIGKQTKNWKDFTILKSKLDERKILSNYETKIRSEKGKRIYSNRMPLIERGFGYVKENIGFRRFLRRGLEKVTNEWFIICSAYNLTRMFNLAYP